MLIQAKEIIQIVSERMFKCTPHSVLNEGSLVNFLDQFY